MKKLLLLSLFILFFSCSGSDDESNTTPQTTYTFFPDNSANSWIYTGFGNSTTSFGSSMINNGLTWINLKNPQNIFGMESENIYMRKSGNDYYLQGNLTVLNTPLEFTNQKFLSNVFTLNTAFNQYTFSQDLPAVPFVQSGWTGTALTTSIITATIIPETLGTKTINNKLYNNVLTVKWYFKIKATTVIKTTSPLALTFTHPLIDETPVGSLEQNFISEIGNGQTIINLDGSQVKLNTTVSYLGQSFDIAPTVNSYQQQINGYKETRTYTLTSYNVTN